MGVFLFFPCLYLLLLLLLAIWHKEMIVTLLMFALGHCDQSYCWRFVPLQSSMWFIYINENGWLSLRNLMLLLQSTVVAVIIASCNTTKGMIIVLTIVLFHNCHLLPQCDMKIPLVVLGAILRSLVAINHCCCCFLRYDVPKYDRCHQSCNQQHIRDLIAAFHHHTTTPRILQCLKYCCHLLLPHKMT